MADNDMFIKPVVYSVPGMEAVEVRRDLVYRRLGDGTELTMDVSLPPGLTAGERRPAVVLVHGGPVPEATWTRIKGWGIFTSYGRLLAASGLVAATFNHRFIGAQELAASAANVAAACQFLREGAAGFHLDPDRLTAWAFSGGGVHLGPLLAARPSWLRCLVAYYPLMDVQTVRETFLSGLSDEALARFSPVVALPESGSAVPPLLIARAGLDQPWINSTVDAFVAKALAANATLDVLNHPRGRHGFDVLDADDRSREIIARTLEFVRAHG
jgi:acetyl esterase/lipase